MGHFNFDHPENERSAQLMLKVRAFVCVIASLNFVAPALMAGQVTEMLQELEGKDTWVRMKPTEKNPTVCQRDKNAMPCADGDGWRETQDGSKCLKLFGERVERSEARDLCSLNSAFLVCLASREQNEDVIKLCGAKSPCWLGLEKGMSGWKWEDFSPVLYTNWHEGEPNDIGGKESAAGIGLDRLAAEVSKPLSDAAGGYILGLVIFLLFLCGVCLCVYCAMSQKSPGLLMCTSSFDCCGTCACCVLFLLSVSTAMAYPGPGTALTVVFALAEMGCLGGLTVYGIILRGHMVDEQSKSMVQGQAWVQPEQPTVLGQVVAFEHQADGQVVQQQG
mmetsp:Transcript_72517/g.208120  ORF Transcript_72517/g.208120 Transcript_72517/m.208120 type:complete len:334 (+) Transcript_72517:178-1179(+)|eukprot:CAMPEP_0177216404 /NCGR_PEP_ID=MMETSP0367-20130122/34739_1 /TAXON_ID=447022 ORGANISM="Scrippsiella hangoei-like, Strain SHHI-4" /NCGR_SAMPLE_ID=MMETSP0367 /ASSEMBLY_ACC=CAM_ASM_000362 /LENGTH=333 /DNA_ID=CAMNT_0018665917 /DNA_START=82 /DNA_END=1083 /DNA_ORIENTATION=+